MGMREDQIRRRISPEDSAWADSVLNAPIRPAPPMRWEDSIIRGMYGRPGSRREELEELLRKVDENAASPEEREQLRSEILAEYEDVAGGGPAVPMRRQPEAATELTGTQADLLSSSIDAQARPRPGPGGPRQGQTTPTQDAAELMGAMRGEEPAGDYSPAGLAPVQARLLRGIRDRPIGRHQAASDLTGGERALARGAQGVAAGLTLGRPEALNAVVPGDPFVSREEEQQLYNVRGQTDVGDVAAVVGEIAGSLPLAYVTGGLANMGAAVMSTRLASRAPRVAAGLRAIATGKTPQEASRAMKFLASSPGRNVYEGLAFSAVAGPAYKLQDGEDRVQRIAMEFGIGAAADFALGMVLGRPGAEMVNTARHLMESDDEILRGVGEAVGRRLDDIDAAEGLDDLQLQAVREQQEQVRRQQMAQARGREWTAVVNPDAAPSGPEVSALRRDVTEALDDVVGSPADELRAPVDERLAAMDLEGRRREAYRAQRQAAEGPPEGGARLVGVDREMVDRAVGEGLEEAGLVTGADELTADLAAAADERLGYLQAEDPEFQARTMDADRALSQEGIQRREAALEEARRRDASRERGQPYTEGGMELGTEVRGTAAESGLPPGPPEFERARFTGVEGPREAGWTMEGTIDDIWQGPSTVQDTEADVAGLLPGPDQGGGPRLRRGEAEAPELTNRRDVVDPERNRPFNTRVAQARAAIQEGGVEALAEQDTRALAQELAGLRRQGRPDVEMEDVLEQVDPLAHGAVADVEIERPERLAGYTVDDIRTTAFRDPRTGEVLGDLEQRVPHDQMQEHLGISDDLRADVLEDGFLLEDGTFVNRAEAQAIGATRGEMVEIAGEQSVNRPFDEPTAPGRARNERVVDEGDLATTEEGDVDLQAMMDEATAAYGDEGAELTAPRPRAEEPDARAPDIEGEPEGAPELTVEDGGAPAPEPGPEPPAVKNRTVKEYVAALAEAESPAQVYEYLADLMEPKLNMRLGPGEGDAIMEYAQELIRRMGGRSEGAGGSPRPRGPSPAPSGGPDAAPPRAPEPEARPEPIRRPSHTGPEPKPGTPEYDELWNSPPLSYLRAKRRWGTPEQLREVIQGIEGSDLPDTAKQSLVERIRADIRGKEASADELEFDELAALRDPETGISREGSVEEITNRVQALRRSQKLVNQGRNPATGAQVGPKRLQQMREALAQEEELIRAQLEEFEVAFGEKAAEQLRRDAGMMRPVRAEPASGDAAELAAIDITALAPEVGRGATPRRVSAARRAIEREQAKFEETTGFMKDVMEPPRAAQETELERIRRMDEGSTSYFTRLNRQRAERAAQNERRLKRMPQEHRDAVRRRLAKYPGEPEKQSPDRVGNAIVEQTRAMMLGLDPDTPGPKISEEWRNAPEALKNIEVRRAAEEARARGEKPIREPRPMTPEEEELVAELARRTEGFAAERRRLQSDRLTGLFNQDALHDALPRLDADPNTHWAAFDLINFKTANDLGSRAEGDDVLRQFGRIIQEVADEMDVPARQLFRGGGDEFYAGVPGSQTDAARFAREVAKRFDREAPSFTNTEGTTFELGARRGVGPTRADADAGVKSAKEGETGPRYRDLEGGAAEDIPSKQALRDSPPEPTERMRELGFEEHPKPLQGAVDQEGTIRPLSEHIEELDRDLANETLDGDTRLAMAEVELGKIGDTYGLDVEEQVRTAMGIEPTMFEPTLKVQSTVRRKASMAAETYTPAEPIFTVAGRTTEVETPSGPIRASYSLVRVGQLQPSHSPFTWEPNPDYFPEGAVQLRDYRANVSNREGVERIVSQPNVRRFLDPTRLANEGPPVVTRDGKSVAGNGRTMALQRLQRERPDVFRAYQDQLRKDAQLYGIDPEGIADDYALVRVIEDDAVDQGDVNQMRELNIAWDRETGKAKTAIEDAASRARILEERGELPLNHLDETLKVEEGQTLRAYLNTADGRKMISQLREIGFFSQEEAGRMIQPNGFLTDKGRDAVEEALMIHAIGNEEAVRLAPALIKTRLEHVIPQVVALRQDGGPWDLSGTIAEAMELHAQVASNDAFAGRQKIKAWKVQRGLLDDFTDRAVGLAQALEEASKKDITEAFRAFFREATLSKRQGQSQDLFGFEPTTPEEAFDTLLRTLLPDEGGGPC